jgi:hypothetical protein
MGWLSRHTGLWSLLAFLLGAIITWFLLVRREQDAARATTERQAEATPVPVSVARGSDSREPFSRRMEPSGFAEVTVFDPEPAGDIATAVVTLDPEKERGAVSQVAPDQADGVLQDTGAEEVPPGRYGEGSADALPHQSPPDGFTIKGNAQSRLFHTPDSPYYGRTKPQVWFRTEADAERAGFTKYVRRPRATQHPTTE